MTWKPRVTVAAVVEHDGRFLMVEEEAGEGLSVFNQPAGHLEEGESLEQTVIREVLEETAHPFTPQAITGIYRWIAPTGDTYLRVCFCGTVTTAGSNELDKGIIAAHWLTLDEIYTVEPRLRSPLVLGCLKDYLAGVRYPLTLLKDYS